MSHRPEPNKKNQINDIFSKFLSIFIKFSIPNIQNFGHVLAAWINFKILDLDKFFIEKFLLKSALVVLYLYGIGTLSANEMFGFSRTVCR